MPKKPEVTLLLLCGGRGTRVGGLDKPLLDFHGKRIIKHMLAALAPKVGQVLICANRNLSDYECLGYPICSDKVEFAGPLAGLASCAAKINTAWVLVCPGDNPLVDPALVSELCNAAETQACDIVLVQDPQRIQSLYFLVSSKCLPQGPIEEFENRSMMSWIDTLRVKILKTEAVIINVNSLDELKNLELEYPRV